MPLSKPMGGLINLVNSYAVSLISPLDSSELVMMYFEAR